jgi:hypothetical protein
MLIIIDHRMPAAAKETLSAYGELLELQTEGITYPAISGHPDIFLCQAPGKLVVAPNLPEHFLKRIIDTKIELITGELPVGNEYPATSRYNVVVTDKYLVHNFRHTDFMITRAFEDHLTVHVDQGYCRCNLLALKDDHFITSDEGIYKVLRRYTENILKVSPEGIILKGFPHGFFGGCCGVWEDKVFINGSLKFYRDGELIRQRLTKLSFQIIELYQGSLFDSGGILFINQS